MSEIKRFEPLWGVWRTVELLGAGSFGKVYKAVRNDGGREYHSAVKHISIPVSESQIKTAVAEGVGSTKEELHDYFDRTAQAFLDEIRLMNAVKGHTNIVSYEDHLVVPKESGIGCDIFIRMELLTGLEDVLGHRQISRDEVIRLGIDICTALEVCAARNIIHRDIKPSNIFVNAGGDFKLGDFGVARELNDTTGGMSKKGTCFYMAPEIYRGEEASRTADIYSLGLVMYRLLNGGRSPFLPPEGAITPRDNSAALSRRMSGEPLPPPAYADPALAQIILTAAQFDRSKRYANPTAMKNSLLWVQSGQAASVRREAPRTAQPETGERTAPVFTAVPTREAAAVGSDMTVGTAVLPEEYEATVGLEGTDERTRETLPMGETAYGGGMALREKTIIAAMLFVVLAVLSVVFIWSAGKNCADAPEQTAGEALSDGDLIIPATWSDLVLSDADSASWSDAVSSSDRITTTTTTTTTTKATTTTTTAAPSTVNIVGIIVSTDVTSLDISDRYFTYEDVVALSKCTKLTELCLTNDNITDITPLAKLTNLTTLTLDFNSITDVTPLAKLTNLTSLALWYNKVSDITPLAGLTNLTSLDISCNSVTDLSPLAKMTNLTWFGMFDNEGDDKRIDDLTPLFGLKKLETILLRGREISIDSLRRLKEALPNCNIYSDYDDYL